MKVLTAARLTWSGVEVGFCDCQPGELVMLGHSCECECHLYDDEECGCGLDCQDEASFIGLVSDQETTTARVEERDLSLAQLSAAVRDGLGRGGWFGPGLTPEIESVLVEIEVGRIREVVSSFAPGTLVGLAHGLPFEVSDSGDAPIQRTRV
jgi:hypothetical protein